MASCLPVQTLRRERRGLKVPTIRSNTMNVINATMNVIMSDNQSQALHGGHAHSFRSVGTRRHLQETGVNTSGLTFSDRHNTHVDKLQWERAGAVYRKQHHSLSCLQT